MKKEISIINNIGYVISEYQKRTGVTKSWIAEQIGVSRQRLSNVIKAENLQVDVLLKLAVVLDCKIADLIDYEVIDILDEQGNSVLFTDDKDSD